MVVCFLRMLLAGLCVSGGGYPVSVGAAVSVDRGMGKERAQEQVI